MQDVKGKTADKGKTEEKRIVSSSRIQEKNKNEQKNPHNVVKRSLKIEGENQSWNMAILNQNDL